MDDTDDVPQDFPDYLRNDDGSINYEGNIDYFDDLDSYDGEELVITRPTDESVTYPEQVRMIHLRSHLNELQAKVDAYQCDAEKCREELKKCQGHILELGNQRDRVFAEIQTSESDNNTAGMYRLRSNHEKICKELEAEEGLAHGIAERLEEAEYELAKAEVVYGNMALVEVNLIEREEQLAYDKSKYAMIRQNKEDKYAKQALNNRKAMEKSQLEAIRVKEERQRQAIEEAKKSHERANKYLEITMQKIRTRQKEEENRYQTNMQKKMDMLLKLKRDIASSRDNLRAVHARETAKQKEQSFIEAEERQRIIQDGGNPGEKILIMKRISEFEKKKSQFDTQQRESKSLIMSKLMKEEDRFKQKKVQQPHLWDSSKKSKEKIVKPLPKKMPQILADYIESTTRKDTFVLRDDLYKSDGDSEQEHENREESARERTVTDQLANSSDSSDAENVDDEVVSLAKPEFEGLWDQHKSYKVPTGDGVGRKVAVGTKMEREILSKVLNKHRDGKIIKQVVAGREFKGCPFYSKPDIIHFKDFVIGEQYRTKVVLTNVSYSVNYCKFVGITERLKDFINVHFDAPGQMSAGLTCEMMVTFKPMIDEDLEGEVHFLAQTGPFSIRVSCTTKKCDLKVESNIIDFGTSVIGETLKRNVTLTNNGALGTTFDFFKMTGMKQRTCTTAETSLGRLTTADTIRPMSPDSVDLTEKVQNVVLPEFKKKLSVDETDKNILDSGTDIDDTQDPLEGGLNPDISGATLEIPEGEIYAEGLSQDFPMSEIEDYGNLDGMKIGSLVSGTIAPFSSVKLEIIWQPTIPGKITSEFLITFSDPTSEGIAVSTQGAAVDVPVWLERQTVDLRICMLDRLYQDTVIANNRATTALRLKFEVCKELRNHLELLPKTGYIQAQSQFSAQLKFLPRKSLFTEASKYFDPQTGVLEAPLLIRVADQTQPVPFTVTAVVTNSDLEFDITSVDFGYSTIFESAMTKVNLTNKSILPQTYGFIGHPDFVEIQPNDGFGTLLPLETIELHVIFSPPKAQNYKFDLCCKSLINREFKIQCKGIGVHPPLEMSHQVVYFRATSVYDISTATIRMMNMHTSSNEYTHPVPRIGTGEIAPVGPTSFEFVVPEGCPITVSPSVGTIEPGLKTMVQIRFNPILTVEDVRKEAVRMAVKVLEAEAYKEYKEALKKEKKEQTATVVKKSGKGKASPRNAKGKGAPVQASTVLQPRSVTPPDGGSIATDSPAYVAAIASLLRQYEGDFSTVTIPCYVASGKCGKPGHLSYSIHNTLYLDVHCPVIKPPLVVISDNGKRTLNFGDISIGQNTTRAITLQNISESHIDLKSSLLDTTGPFQNLNAMRSLEPGGTHTAVISFTPNAGRIFQEVFEVHTPTASLFITLKGRGVSPIVTLSIESEMMDMGTVLSGEYVEKSFKINNTSSLSIDYVIKQDSLSLLRHAKSQIIPAFVERVSIPKVIVGTQNFNGQNVFDIVPSKGTIEAGGSKEVTVTFAPDHTSDLYSDGVRVELFNEEESHFFRLIGGAKDHIMFLEGGEKLTPTVESLSLVPTLADDDGVPIRPPPAPLLVTISSVTNGEEFSVATADIYVGCVRTMAVSQKKNGEFQVENLLALQAKGITVDPQRGMIEAGTKKPITMTWTPPQGYDPSQPSQTSMLVTLKGDVNEQVRVLLMTMVKTE